MFIVIRDSIEKEILGTFRMTLKAEHLTFPIEDYFGVDLSKLCSTLPMQPKEVWHCGRICVDKEKLQQLGYRKKDSLLYLRLWLSI